MRAAAELQNLNGAPTLLLFQAVAQQNHIVCDELLDPEAADAALFFRALHEDMAVRTYLVGQLRGP